MPSRREILEALDRLEGDVLRGFRDAVARIKSRARLQALADAIESNDLELAFRLAGIRDGGWTQLTEQIRQAYIAGGELAADDAPARLGFAFDINNPRASEWLVAVSSELVTRINEEQRQAVRLALREGFDLGQGPRQTALDIVGRINRRTGRREGGIVGLTDQMVEAVFNARRQLLSGDPGELRAYLNRERRDKRFDSIVIRAIEAGEPVSAGDVQRMTARYADRLLELRGQNIARTESLGALNEAMDESLRQAVDQGLIQPENIRRTWVSAGDGRVRDAHSAMNGQEVGLGEAFVDPNTGQRLMHPGDRSLGASAANIINCRCNVRQEVDWFAEEGLV
jgi:hypothetical protein